MEIRSKDFSIKPCFPTITLADLAGSESIGDKDDFKSGSFINKSLLALTKVITKLSKKKDNKDQFVVYRESKLTRILKPYLSGTSRTAVICTINPDRKYTTESIQTIRFG